MSLSSATNEYLSQLIDVGADAMSNLFKVEFTGGVFNVNPTQWTVRLNEFTPPDFKQVVDNNVNYLTTGITLPKAAITGTKSFTVKFRLDENYDLYRKLLIEQTQLATMNKNLISDNLDPTHTFTTKVYRVNGAIKESTDDIDWELLYTYKYCFIKKISGLTYSYENNGVESISAEIGFWDFSSKFFEENTEATDIKKENTKNRFSETRMA